MTWTIQSTDLRQRVREVLDRVRVQREPVIVSSYDTPQAVIIPYDDFKDFKEWQAHRKRSDERWQTEFQALTARVHARTVAFASDEIEADITLAAAQAKELRRAHRTA